MGSIPHPTSKRWFGRVLLDTLSEGVLSSIVFIFRFVWWGTRWTSASLLMVAVMVGAGYFVFNEALQGGDPVTVPNVVGMDVSYAWRELNARGLEVGKQVAMPSSVPKNHVIAQRPASDRVVRTGRKVYLTVSTGDEYIKAPNLLRKPLSEALDTIRQFGFREGSRARLIHAAARDTVIGQDPGPDQLINRDAEISLLVSDGQSGRTLLMPDLTGMTIAQVTKTLDDLGVTATPVADDSGPQEDVVLSQKPDPGTLIQAGDTVLYHIHPSGAISLPTSLRKVNIRYTVPLDWLQRGLQADIIGPSGLPTTRTYSVPEQTADPMTVTQPATFKDTLTVEFFVTMYDENGPHRVKTCRIEYQGDAAPVVAYSDVSQVLEGQGRVEGQDSAVNPSQ